MMVFERVYLTWETGGLGSYQTDTPFAISVATRHLVPKALFNVAMGPEMRGLLHMVRLVRKINGSTPWIGSNVQQIKPNIPYGDSLRSPNVLMS